MALKKKKLQDNQDPEGESPQRRRTDTKPCCSTWTLWDVYGYMDQQKCVGQWVIKTLDCCGTLRVSCEFIGIVVDGSFGLRSGALFGFVLKSNSLPGGCLTDSRDGRHGASS